MPVLLNCHCFSAPRTPCALAQIYICTFILYFYHMITKQLLWFWCPCLSFVGKRKEVSCSFVMWAEANIRRISNDYLQGLPFLRDSTLICLVTSLWPRADCCRLYCPVDPVWFRLILELCSVYLPTRALLLMVASMWSPSTSCGCWCFSQSAHARLLCPHLEPYF